MNYFDIIHAYLGFLVSFYGDSADQNEKNIVGSEYRNNRYFLSVSILFFKTLTSKDLRTYSRTILRTSIDYAPIREL
jgi:hypothetical protein